MRIVLRETLYLEGINELDDTKHQGYASLKDSAARHMDSAARHCYGDLRNFFRSVLNRRSYPSRVVV